MLERLSPKNRNHLLTSGAIEHLELRVEWVPTDAVGDEPEKQLAAYGGLWITSGSPYRNMDGALAVIRYARKRGVPNRYSF